MFKLGDRGLGYYFDRKYIEDMKRKHTEEQWVDTRDDAALDADPSRRREKMNLSAEAMFISLKEVIDQYKKYKK